MLRSAALGITVVHHRLNAGRAMMVCWSTNRVSSPVLMRRESRTGPGVPVSIDLGTTQPPTNPIA